MDSVAATCPIHLDLIMNNFKVCIWPRGFFRFWYLYKVEISIPKEFVLFLHYFNKELHVSFKVLTSTTLLKVVRVLRFGDWWCQNRNTFNKSLMSARISCPCCNKLFSVVGLQVFGWNSAEFSVIWETHGNKSFFLIHCVSYRRSDSQAAESCVELG